MNLTITQDNTRTETINSSIIDKLYEIAFAASSDPNSTVSLTGRLESPKGYKFKIDWLNTEFNPDLIITVPTSGLYILFEDSAVESLLISGGFSTDGTGISLTDAANATFTNSTFKDNTTITSFNEFPYFTKANTNPPTSLFEGCSNLEDIDLTSTTAISLYEFRRSGIKTANLPSLTSLGTESFAYCSNLETVTDLGNVTSIPNGTFQNCTSITSITLPSTCTSIGNNAFLNCSGFTSITIPSSIVSIKEHAFSRSGNPITNLQLHSSITNIERGAFAKISYPNSCFYLPLLIGSTSTRDMFCYYYGNGGYMSQIGQLYLPHLINMTTTGHGSYPYWSGLFTCLKALLIYLKDITDLYPGTFSNSDILAIVINNTVPPTLNNSTDNRLEEGAYNTAIFNVVSNWSGFIYVPDGYVNTYISAWENVLDSTRGNSAGSTIRTDIVLKNRIKSISELPTYATEADWIAANRPLGLITAYMS